MLFRLKWPWDRLKVYKHRERKSLLAACVSDADRPLSQLLVGILNILRLAKFPMNSNCSRCVPALQVYVVLIKTLMIVALYRGSAAKLANAEILHPHGGPSIA